MLRKRFFHTPIFHTHSDKKEKKVTWLELFYDLVYVAAFIQLGDAFSNNISMDTFLKSAGIFISMWFSWTGFTYYANRFTVDDFLHRILVFLQMFCVGAMAISIPNLLNGHPYIYGFAYSLSVFIISALHLRAYIQQKIGRDYSLYWGGVFFIMGLFWLVSLASAQYYYVGWILGCLVIFASPLSPKARYLIDYYPLDLEHLSERYGLLTIIVLGESFVKVLSHLNSNGVGGLEIIQASFALLLTCSIWWIYFDDIASAQLKKTTNAMVTWLFTHLPLQFSIILMGVGIKKTTTIPFDSIIPFKYAILLGGAIGMILISAGITDSATERRHSELNETTRIGTRIFAGFLIIALASISHSMTNLWFIAGCLFVCLAQVVFDIFFSPYDLEEDDDIESSTEFSQTITEKKRETLKDSIRLEVVRKGLPNDLKKDLYFYFVEASWIQIFVAMFFIYILSNVFFAILFLMTPDSITTEQNTFSEAFFFSVQTMSTVGYGTLSPQGFYSNIIATVEIAFGLVGVAVITGLIFAKISRPNVKILFSQNMILSKINGKYCLSFRVSNTRGNDIVEANMTLSVLIDEITEEGESLRRIKDLKLVRSKSSLFRLSWTIMHEVDENSPLHNLDLSSGKVLSIIANMSGHDGTYSNTVYARHNYYPADILKDRYFEDIIYHMPDGRLLVDYEKFHSIKD